MSCNNLKIERIISKGHCSPDDFWYDEPLNEFVLVVKGCGVIKLKKNGKEIRLEPGDYYNIPAHEKHRVEWTDENTETIWLAVYYS